MNKNPLHFRLATWHKFFLCQFYFCKTAQALKFIHILDEEQSFFSFSLKSQCFFSL